MYMRQLYRHCLCAGYPCIHTVSVPSSCRVPCPMVLACIENSALHAVCHCDRAVSANTSSAMYGHGHAFIFKIIMSSSPDSAGAPATALMERAQPGMAPSKSAAQAHWAHQPVQQADMPMPHRNRDPIRSALRKLFGRRKPPASDIKQSPDRQVSHKITADPVAVDSCLVRHMYNCRSCGNW